MAPAQEPRNYLDADELPNCLVCGHNIRPADFAAPWMTAWSTGAACGEAFAEPEPCEPRRNGYLREA